MNRWLFKTEPTDYSFEDLVRDGKARWDGVTNALALKHLRTIARGDEVMIYHTGKVKAAVGLARVKKGSYPDPEAGDAKIVVVDLEPGRPLPKPVPLEAIKKETRFKAFDLVRIGRLSVMPVPDATWKALLKMAGA